MSTWNQNFTSVSEIVNALKTIPLWTSLGKIDSVEITTIDPEREGSVILYCTLFNSRIRNSQRYSFTSNGVLALTFSSVIPGLNLYLSEDPSNNVDAWNSLPEQSKEAYIKTGEKLFLSGNLIPRWPVSTNINFTPDIEVRTADGVIANGETLSFETFINDTNSVVLTIKNRGTKSLLFPGLEKVIFSGVGSSYFSAVNALPNFLDPGEEASLEISFAPTVEGLLSAQLLIPNNDPQDGSFIIDLLGNSLAAKQAVFSLGREIDESGQIKFFASPTSSPSVRVLTIRNEGDENLLITSLTLGPNHSALENLSNYSIAPGETASLTLSLDVIDLGENLSSVAFEGEVSPGVLFSTNYDVVGFGYTI